MKKPKIVETHDLHKGFFDLRQDLLEKEDGTQHTYHTLVLPADATAILAQDESGQFILTREYRHPTGLSLLGCPGGRLEEGEDPLMGAKRELLEETGYSGELLSIGLCYPFPGVSNQKIYFFWAPKAHLMQKPQLDPFEFIEVEKKSEKELKEEILSGKAIDGVLVSLLWFKEHFSLSQLRLRDRFDKIER